MFHNTHNLAYREHQLISHETRPRFEEMIVHGTNEFGRALFDDSEDQSPEEPEIPVASPEQQYEYRW